MPADEFTIADHPEGKRLTAGTEIGMYRIEFVLGEGGMGTVYRALDTKLNRPVAIKVLSDELANVSARRQVSARSPDGLLTEPSAHFDRPRCRRVRGAPIPGHGIR